MIYVKQFGLKRSGTNAARWLLEQNFRDVRVLADVMGWKHGPPRLSPTWNPSEWYPEHAKPIVMPLPAGMIADVKRQAAAGEIRFHLIVKNPYAWIVSSLRWKGIRIEAATEAIVRARAKHWIKRGYEYLDFAEAAEAAGVPCVLSDSGSLFERIEVIGRELRLERARTVWVRPPRVFRPTGDLRAGDAMMHKKPYDDSYYRDARYMDEIPDATLAWINEELNHHVVGWLGYRITER